MTYRRREISTLKSKLINERIKSEKVFLILEDGENKGIVSRYEALNLSREAGLDLVLLSQKGNEPPICKLMDYGKVKYDEKKKKSKKNNIETKEIHLRNALGIDIHDLQTKHRQIKKFIEKKHKVKYVFTVRGRQRRDMQEALKKCNENISEFLDIATWTEPKIAGGSIIVVLSPKSG